MSRVLIFVGPTLSSEQIHAIAPHVEIHPPVAAGDLLRLPLDAGDLVAIIDGYYFQSAAVRHKEILSLLQRGIHVWGAASMGALRAADLAPFGMRGFGRIFQAYRLGEIEGDDEVAVLHAPPEMEYMQLSEALVNIRHACREGVAEGILSSEACQLIIDIASELPFFERTYKRIFQEVREKGLAQQEIDRFQPFVQQEHLSLKKSDALTLVRALNSPPQEAFFPAFELQETSLLRTWKIEEQGVWVKQQWIAYRDLLAAYQLFGEDYPAVHYHILLEHMAEVIKSSHPAQRGPGGKTGLSSFRAGVSPGSQPWCTALVAQYFSTHYGFRFDEDLPANVQRWIRTGEMTLPRSEQFARISVRVGESLGWQEVLFQRIKTSELLPLLAKIIYQSRQFHKALLKHDSVLDPALLSPKKICAWFGRRWGESEPDFDCAIRDRGFHSLADFLNAARSFYLFDKYVGVPGFGGLLSF